MIILKAQGCDVVEIRFDEHEFIRSEDSCRKTCSTSTNTQPLEPIKRVELGVLTTLTVMNYLKNFSTLQVGVDIELKSDLSKYQKRPDFPESMTAAGSFHDYKKCPTQEELTTLINEGRSGSQYGEISSDNEANDRDTLEATLKSHSDSSLALMGMGPEGLETRFTLPPLAQSSHMAFLINPQHQVNLPVQL